MSIYKFQLLITMIASVMILVAYFYFNNINSKQPLSNSTNQNSSQIFNISLPNMQNAFTRMQNEAGWNTTEKMYWSYYFLDSDPEKLKALAKRLESENFKQVDLTQTEDENLYLLHLEEYAVHTPESLYTHCVKLAEIVTEMEIEIFDGWDVEATKFEKVPVVD